jgi:hypothetical protein
MITVIGKSRGLPWPAKPLYYGEIRVLGRPVLCTIPNRSPSVAIESAREMMGMIS